MAFFNKKEFAEKCGLEPKNLAVYIGRGKVVVTRKGDEDVIDTSISQNKLFLEKRKGRQTEKQLVEEFKRRPALVEGMEDYPIDEQFRTVASGNARSSNEKKDGPPMDLVQSTEWLRYRDAIKREKEIEKLELDNQRKRGEVIPTVLIGPLVFQMNQSIMTAFKNGAEEIVRMMGKKYGMTAADMSEMRGQLIKITNTAMDKARDLTLANVRAIVNEHQEKRGVGERK